VVDNHFPPFGLVAVNLWIIVLMNCTTGHCVGALLSENSTLFFVSCISHPKHKKRLGSENADRGRVVKADIPCSLGGGRHGFDPRQLRRTKRAFIPLLAICNEA
jgi:hypothetical protein